MVGWCTSFAALLRVTLAQYFARPAVVVATIVLCAVAVGAASQISSERDSILVLIEPAGTTEKILETASRRLTAFSNIETSIIKGAVPEGRRIWGNPRITLVARWDGEQWTVGYRAPFQRNEANLVLAASSASAAMNTDASITGRLLNFTSSGTTASGRETALSGSTSRLFVPRTIALLVVLLAFIFAAWSYSRHAGSRMVATILTAPRGGWGALCAATIVGAVWLSLLLCLVLLLMLRPLYGVSLKPNSGSVFLAVTLGCATSALLGLCSAALMRLDNRTHLSASIYFLFLMLSSGFLVPLSESSVVIQALSFLSPLRFVHESLEYWLFFGMGAFGPSLVVLTAQVGVAMLLLVATSQVAKRAL